MTITIHHEIKKRAPQGFYLTTTAYIGKAVAAVKISRWPNEELQHTKQLTEFINEHEAQVMAQL